MKSCNREAGEVEEEEEATGVGSCAGREECYESET